MLYGVDDEKLYKGQIPSNSDENWLETAQLVGESGRASFDFLFFDSMEILHGVENGKLHKRSPPTYTGDD